MLLFLLNLAKILWFLWDMGLKLFDIPKDAAFGEIVVLSNILGFPAINWAPKWTKTVNFGCVPSELKFKTLKEFSNTAFVLSKDYLCSKFQQDWTIFCGVSAQNPIKGAISWMLNQYKQLWKFLTSQPQMLPQIYILIRHFIWQNREA